MEADKNLMKILVEVQKKYNVFNEIQDLTMQMEDSLKRNDQVSFQMLLEMRLDSMIKIDGIEETIRVYLQSFPEKEQSLIKKQMSAEAEINAEYSPELIKMGDITGKTRRIIEKIIAVDKVMNIKIAGKDSFYNQGK